MYPLASYSFLADARLIASFTKYFSHNLCLKILHKKVFLIYYLKPMLNLSLKITVIFKALYLIFYKKNVNLWGWFWILRFIKHHINVYRFLNIYLVMTEYEIVERSQLSFSPWCPGCAGSEWLSAVRASKWNPGRHFLHNRMHEILLHLCDKSFTCKWYLARHKSNNFHFFPKL